MTATFWNHYRPLIVRLLVGAISIGLLVLSATDQANAAVEIQSSSPRTLTVSPDQPMEILLSVRHQADWSCRWELLGVGRLEGDVRDPAILYIPPRSVDHPPARATIRITVTDSSGKTLTDSLTFILESSETDPDHPDDPAEPTVETLLQQAEVSIKKQYYTTPEGRSAFYYYRQVLQRSPENRRAIEGLNQILDYYAKRIRSAVSSSTAESYWKRYQKVIAYLKTVAHDEARQTEFERLQRHGDLLRWKRIGRDRLQSGRLSEALDACNRIIAIDPKSGLAMQMIVQLIETADQKGRQQILEGNYGAARKTFEVALNALEAVSAPQSRRIEHLPPQSAIQGRIRMLETLQKADQALAAGLPDQAWSLYIQSYNADFKELMEEKAREVAHRYLAFAIYAIDAAQYRIAALNLRHYMMTAEMVGRIATNSGSALVNVIESRKNRIDKAIQEGDACLVRADEDIVCALSHFSDVLEIDPLNIDVRTRLQPKAKDAYRKNNVLIFNNIMETLIYNPLKSAMVRYQIGSSDTDRILALTELVGLYKNNIEMLSSYAKTSSDMVSVLHAMQMEYQKYQKYLVDAKEAISRRAQIRP